MSHVKVAIWGENLGFCIPKRMADSLDIHVGDTLEVSPTGEGMLVKKTSHTASPSTKLYRLADILDSFPSSSDHPEVDFGGPVGEEAW